MNPEETIALSFVPVTALMRGGLAARLREDDPTLVELARRHLPAAPASVAADGHEFWAVGPAAVGSRVLASAEAPDLQLPDLEGNTFRLSSLRGQKVLLYAWAPY